MEQTAPVLTSQKLQYCCWTYLSTFLGGYKYTIEESGQEVSLLAHLIQFLLYFIIPLIPIILAIVTHNYQLTIIISGVVVSFLIIGMNLISIYQSKSSTNKVTNIKPVYSQQEQNIFQMLVKSKNLAEMILVIVLTPLYSVLAASAYFYLIQHKYVGLLVVEFLTSCTIYQSLLNSSVVEPGVLSSDNQSVGVYSSLMSRPIYACLFLILTLIGDLKESTGTLSLIANIIYAINPVLFIVGLFGSFGALYQLILDKSLEYMMEQFNTVASGSSACASFLRTAITFSLNISVAIIMGFGLSNNNSVAQYISILIIGVLSLRAKFNLMRECGLQKIRFRCFNKNYSDEAIFVLSSTTRSNTIISVTTSVIEAIIIIVISVTVKQPSNTTILIIFIICLVLFLIMSIVTQIQKRMLIGLIRSFHIQSENLALTLNILRKTHEIIQQLLITLTCLNLTNNDQHHQSYQIAFLGAALIQRVFQLSHSNPSMLILTQIISLIISVNQTSPLVGYNFIVIGFITQIAYRSLNNLLQRLQIWPYAFYKMLTVKKQRVKQAYILFVVQLVILLPLSLLTLVLSSICDVPYLPYLGLPLFTVGSMRPIRNWGVLQRSIRSTSESSVYNSWLSIATMQIKETLIKGHINLSCGQYFLVRLSKYIVTIQIIEYSSCYIVFAVRGLESQETTSCHGVEAREVDRMVQQYFNVPAEDGTLSEQRLINADCCGTLTPYGSMRVTTYGENQIKLTGIIEDQDFIAGFKNIFLRILCTMAMQSIDETDRKMINHMGMDLFGAIYADNKEQSRVLSFFPQKYSELIGMREKFDIQANTNDEESEKYLSPPKKPVVQQNQDFDEIGMLMRDLDDLGVVQDKRDKYASKPNQQKTTIQNDDDDIFGMLDNLQYQMPVQIQKPLTKQVVNQIQMSEKTSLYINLQKVIMLCYVLAFNDPSIVLESRVNNLLLYNLFKDSESFKASRQFKQSDSFKKIYKMVLQSIRLALKISIDIFAIEGTLKSIDDAEIQTAYESLASECYVGTGIDPEWNLSIKKKIPTLWSLGYLNSQNTLVVYRFTRDPVDSYIFEMNNDIVKGIQANLQFELYFVTNDDDERYAIQTHQQFLRNIIIESAEEPLGYSPFYSGPIIVSQ